MSIRNARFLVVSLLIAAAGIVWVRGGGASEPVTVSVQTELSQDGNNYDDPCFWQDPRDPSRFLAFMTSKDDRLVDVWEMPAGVHVGQITGFEKKANNCDVDQVNDRIVTTDPDAVEVRVHGLPDLRLQRVIKGEHMKEPSGVAVGHADGESYAFVTDESAHEVQVFRLSDGVEVRRFPYNLKKAEGISADDDYQRVYVSDDKTDERGTKAFTFEGQEVFEFGVAETGSDSEGNAVYRCGPEAGYIIVSDQRESNRASAYSEFEVYDRQTFEHRGTFRMKAGADDWTGATDGIDVFQGSGAGATGGVFAACDGCGRHAQSKDELDLVGWRDIAKALDLRVCPGGEPVTELATEDADDGPAAKRHVIPLDGTFDRKYRNKKVPEATTIDARDAVFLSSPDNPYPINLGGDGDVCVAGGTVRGQFTRTWSWDRMHDLNNAGIAFENEGLVVDGIRIDNVTDGIRPRPGRSFTVRNAWLSYIRDDCVENDHLEGGLIENSLFDGCYVAVSARPSKAKISHGVNGSKNRLTIRRSLIRLAPMPGPRGGSPDGLGHGGFFKWHKWDKPSQSLSPDLALYDNIFMAERVGQSRADKMSTPPGRVVDCANNVMVWLGPGEYPAALPDCFRVTKDRTVWDEAVAKFVREHEASAKAAACAGDRSRVVAHVSSRDRLSR